MMSAKRPRATAAFCGVSPLAVRARGVSASTVAPRRQTTVMRSRRKPKGPSKTPREKREVFESIAAEYGLKKPRLGQELDDKLARSAPEEYPLYLRLVGAVGQDRLDTAEKAMFVLLGVIFTGFLVAGLAISSLAYFKAVGSSPPDGWDEFVSNNLEGAFTPALFVFLGLSSLYGLYKQAQLNAGSTAYTEVDKKR